MRRLLTRCCWLCSHSGAVFPSQQFSLMLCKSGPAATLISWIALVSQWLGCLSPHRNRHASLFPITSHSLVLFSLNHVGGLYRSCLGKYVVTDDFVEMSHITASSSGWCFLFIFGLWWSLLIPVYLQSGKVLNLFIILFVYVFFFTPPSDKMEVLCAVKNTTFLKLFFQEHSKLISFTPQCCSHCSHNSK